MLLEHGNEMLLRWRGLSVMAVKRTGTWQGYVGQYLYVGTSVFISSLRPRWSWRTYASVKTWKPNRPRWSIQQSQGANLVDMKWWREEHVLFLVCYEVMEGRTCTFSCLLWRIGKWVDPWLLSAFVVSSSLSLSTFTPSQHSSSSQELKDEEAATQQHRALQGILAVIERIRERIAYALTLIDDIH